MKRIGLISDSHSFLDQQIIKHFQDCDEIWHAGDIGTLDICQQLEQLKTFRAVYGNIDDINVQNLYPENNFFELEGFKILITHIAGKPEKYTARAKKLLKEYLPDIFICGHSHILQVKTDVSFGKMLFINPGAVGNEGFHSIRTMIKFELNQHKIENMKVIELGKRGFAKQ
jgi:putative phosphoesterase